VEQNKFGTAFKKSTFKKVKQNNRTIKKSTFKKSTFKKVEQNKFGTTFKKSTFKKVEQNNRTIKKSTFKKSTFKKVEQNKFGTFRKGGKGGNNKKIEYFFPVFSKTKRNKDKVCNTINHCENKMNGGGMRYNEQFIDLMEKLSSIMLKKGEPFRARAYQKAQETLMSYPDDIINVEQLKGKPGIGSTILEKLNEFVTTGTLKILEREKNNPINILGEIYGVGPKKAKELVDKGITTIEQLRERSNEVLNDVQKVGLKYYEDILKRIPRSEIVEYEKIFDTDFKKVVETIGKDDESRMEIVGSYRRGAESSGDIDVIITSKVPTVFVKFIDELIKEKIIVEVLSRGPTKCLVIAKIPSSDSARRVDFLYTTPEEYPFSVLYFTGSKIFNTVMRHEALQMGLTMNEHGLYKMEGKKKGSKVEAVFKNEKDIFDYLNLVYKSPIERTDGRAVMKIGNKEENKGENVTTLLMADKLAENAGVVGVVGVLEGSEVVDVAKPNKVRKTIRKKDVVVTGKKVGSLKNKEKKEKKMVVEDVDDVVEDVEGVANEKEIIDLLNDFKKTGISVLENLPENVLSEMVVVSNELYRNQKPIINDNQFDILEDFIREKFPENKVIRLIGAPIPVGKNKAVLPYEMWSMDKIKPDTKALDSWKKKFQGPYVISCKLDGVSGLYTTEGTGGPKLYTRGDGKVGQDVSHFIPYLRLPSGNVGKGVVIRGEFVIPKAVFDEKYKKDFANARNLVSGIVNQKSIDQKIKDVHFVAYEVIVPTLKPSEQFEFLKNLDIDSVLYEEIGGSSSGSGDKLTNEYLSETLIDWRKNYAYEIDGVIVVDDKIYPRKSGNPEHAFAFKMVLSDQVAESTVVDVLWSPSKDGYLKPRVQIKPVNLGGVRIEFATGFNGSFIKDNMIGIGAVVEIIRSGDVIPYIKKVVVGAEEPKMPSVPYKWNDTHVDVLLEDKMTDVTVREKNIAKFFKDIGVEGLGSGNVSRIIKSGYDSVPKIINMSVDDLMGVEGFQKTTANKIHNGIRDRLDKVSLPTLMTATNIFGRGFSDKKIELIMENYKDVFTSKIGEEEKIKRISEIKGMALKSAKDFVEKIDDFEDFLMETDMFYKLNQYEKARVEGSVKEKAVDVTNPLYGKSIVFSGFRNAELEKKLKEMGAKIGSSVSKNTFAVVVKDSEGDETGKVLDAKKLGVMVVSLDEFVGNYKI
jgi:NAD-dependent DNA ligase